MIHYLPLLILGTSGIIFVIVGILVASANNKRRKSCTEVTTGKVIKYCYPGNQSVGPVAEYYVEGKKYKASKKYRYFSSITKRKSVKDFNPSNASIYVDDNDVFHISSGGVINYKKLAAETWPIGSEIKVFYNPEKPKKAYLERIPKKGSIIPLVFIPVGLFFVALGVLLTIVLPV